MGMTIDEALGYMPCLMEACSHCLVKGCDKPIEKIDEAKLMVINIMRKYQKIVQIMERTVDDGTSMYDTLQEIEEVIEDGNEDKRNDHRQI